MYIFNVSIAKRKLSTLIDLALAGHKVVIALADEQLIKLTPCKQLDNRPRVGGQWAGQVERDFNFDEKGKEISDLFYPSETLPDSGS